MSLVNNNLKIKTASFCQDQNNILEQLLIYLQNNYKQFQDLNYFYDNSFYLVLTSLNAQRNQEVGLIIHRLKKTEKIENQYSSLHEINQIQNQIQFGQIFSSFMIIIQTEESHELEQNQNFFQEAFFVQELRIINNQNYKKENKVFTLDEINKENSLMVSQLMIDCDWNQKFEYYEENFIQKLEMCKNLNSLNYQQLYSEVSEEDLNKIFLKIEKCENFIDLTLYFKIQDSTIDFDSYLNKLQNLNKLVNLNIKIQNTINQIKFSSIGNLSQLNQLSIIRYNSLIKNQFDLQSLAEAISKLKNLNHLTIHLQDEENQLNSFFQGFPKSSNIIYLNLELTLDFQGQEWTNYFGKMLANQIYLKQLTISIKQNDVKQNSFRSLISSLQYLKYLTDLNITLKFSSINLQGVGDELSKCKNLTFFTFHLIRSDDILAQPQELINGLVELPKLKVLYLNFQSILEDNNILTCCCNLLSKNTNIEKFNLQSEGFVIIEDKIIVEEQIKNLKSLKFHFRFQNQKIGYFTQFLQKCSQLNKLKLNLSNTDIKFEGLIELGKCIKTMSNLYSFQSDFSFGEQENQAFIQFFELLQQCQNLKRLKMRMWHVDLSSDACIQIAKQLAVFPKLTQLRFVISSLSQQTADSMVKILINNQLINLLAIGLNQVYGKSIKNLTKKSILKMRRLVHIQYNIY
ncbi:hypothetical protein TTHERM_00577010 (macronuclear) [Tetrahymena thermophila SB210]|uniref:Kinase domain protein n=1 Tax=Tetrahymena thermophila (strain SB210) TaxID=312017 RepID=Q22V02_TETTS|nr:hypothetical protein TTHERM_00577010 [Tetrahymena thermophila SB210]EAR89146.2 hypothetical protein TTHERM_00577010 [Tetrahymena thermophila SB210]|eukprot:XP_001009391.2 hypothetical protein TTHERM_00577010 [Tetrahymena thermophila SB210]